MTFWSSIRRVRDEMLHGERPRLRNKRIGTKVLFAGLVAALMVCPEAGMSAAQPAPIGSGSSLGTTLPTNFPVIINPYLGVPVIGFGSKLPSSRRHVPVIFLHGNNDTPFATACNPFGYIHNFAEYFLENGYLAGELWGLGYQGDQCDLLSDPTLKSGVAHSTAAAVPLLR